MACSRLLNINVSLLLDQCSWRQEYEQAIPTCWFRGYQLVDKGKKGNNTLPIFSEDTKIALPSANFA